MSQRSLQTGEAADEGGKQPSFDQILERLRGVVAKLEAGELTLEQSLAVFEEGVKLSRRGNEILDAAERRVEILLRAEDGGTRTEPFSEADEE
jgi:exodeoxyribonuclease VII small subunit